MASVALIVVLALCFAPCSYGYQRMRFAVLDKEDAARLREAKAGSVDSGWLENVKQQLDRGLVSPETIRALIDLDLLSQSACDEGLQKSLRSYRLSVPVFALRYGWLFVLGGCCGAAWSLFGGSGFFGTSLMSSLACGIFFGSIAALTTADMQFRIIPIPFLVCFAVSAPLSFGSSLLTYLLASVVFALLICAFVKIAEKLSKGSGLVGLGDVLLLAVSGGTLFAMGLDYFVRIFFIWFVFIFVGSLIAAIVVLVQAVCVGRRVASSDSSIGLGHTLTAAIFGVGIRRALRARVPAGPIYTWSLGLTLVVFFYLL